MLEPILFAQRDEHTQIQDPLVTHYIGEIIKCYKDSKKPFGQCFDVKIQGDNKPCQRALSCILRPRVGDWVHILDCPKGQFILNILTTEIAKLREYDMGEEAECRAGNINFRANQWVEQISNYKLSQSPQSIQHHEQYTLNSKGIYLNNG